jgi:hypothetical protein
MLARIARQRPRYFGKMDLTAGYHQAPLSHEAKPLTAFTTSMGVYQWRRVPMGLKAAPAYFQRMIQSVVLAGLLSNICESYLDDMLTYGQTEAALLKNLRAIFSRFRKYKMTLNPKKCEFGVEEVEFIGHTLNNGTKSFSREKRTKVLDFPLPERQKQLKAFIGLVNYFRSHVANMSDKLHVLQELITPYHKLTKLDWGADQKQKFFNLRDVVAKCPKMHFVDETSPIHVQTDASDIGIGGYIFQINQGQQRMAGSVHQ